MWTQIKQALTLPAFEDEEETRVARLLYDMVRALLAFTFIAYVGMAMAGGQPFVGNLNNYVIFGLLLGLDLLLYVFLRRGKTWLASMMLTFVLFAIVTFSIYLFDGVNDPTISAYFLCIIIAGLLLGRRGATLYIVLCIVATLGVWHVKESGLLAYSPAPTPAPFKALLYIVMFILSGLLLRYASDSLMGALKRARDNERALAAYARELAIFRAVGNHAPDAVAIADLAGKITYANPACCELYGYDYDRREMVGLGIASFWPEKDAPLLAEMVQPQTLTSSWHGETQQRRKDGALFISDLTIFPVRDSEGKIIGVATVMQNIAQRKQAEKALRESEALYRSLVETSPDAITLTDLGGNIIVGNRQAAILYGLERIDEASGENAFEFIAPEDRPRALANLQRALETGSVRNVEYTFLRKDGARFTGELNASLVLGAEGKPTSFIGIMRDITERKQMEEALRESEERYRRLVEFSPVGIAIHREGKIIFANPACARLLGADTPDQLIGRPILDLAPPAYQETITERIRQIAAGQTVPMLEEKFVRLDGRDIDVEVSAIPFVHEGKPAIHVVFQDITERKQAEESLRQYAVELEARNEELDAYAHTVAHDLKAPLGLIIGHAEVLVEDYDALPTGQRLNSLHIIVKTARKINNIIQELLLLSEVRKADVKTTPLDMASIVAEAQQRLADRMADAHAQITLPDASAWPVALGYGPWIEEVWVNYISNAIQYGGQPPRLELGADPLPNPPPLAGEGKGGGYIRFWVRDNGAGIAPEDQARLFTPFTQLYQVRAEGHGLGLSIVRRIVEKLDGQVGVESQVGQGSVFSFTLPSAFSV